MGWAISTRIGPLTQVATWPVLAACAGERAVVDRPLRRRGLLTSEPRHERADEGRHRPLFGETLTSSVVSPIDRFG